jgi:transmembrane sensor
MSSTDYQPSDSKVTNELIAEAAAWVAILHGPSRTRSAERGFAQWLKRSDSHAIAFEEATQIWEEARALPRPRRLRSYRQAPRGTFMMRQIGVAALALFILGIGAWYLMRDTSIATGIGEQRVLALADGSRVILNTQTRVVVKYSDEARRIELKEGEALFEVAKRPERPFYVTAGDRTIQALGTSFAVRRDKDRVAVTLVEGKVTVAPTAQLEKTVPTVVLTPGERVLFSREKQAQTDHPSMDKVLAWQRREVAFTDVALAEAIAEMNRYSREPLVAQIADGQRQPIRVTGLFRAGDSMSFARAVAAAYQLDVVEQGDEIRLVAR